MLSRCSLCFTVRLKTYSKEKKMKDKKTLGWVLLVVGSGLGLLTLLLSPIAMYGIYLLLVITKLESEKQ